MRLPNARGQRTRPPASPRGCGRTRRTRSRRRKRSSSEMGRSVTATGGARGFIVVAVLWILAALSALVLIYLTYVTNTAVVVAAGADRVQGEALIGAGVELAAFQLGNVRDSARPTSGTFNARVGAGTVVVTFRSEAARVDLNAAPKSLLAGLIIGLGANPSDAASYAE